MAIVLESSRTKAGAFGFSGMNIHVINLRRRNDRREQFLGWNTRQGLSFSFFDAVEGNEALRADLVERGLLNDSEHWFTLGSLGSAMSHRTLLQRCLAENENFLIAEDDACLRSDFTAMLPEVIARAGPDWDLIYLGYNTDATIAIENADGSVSSIAFDDSIKGQSTFFEEFRTAAYESEPPHVARCYQAWGLLAYVVSPAGASKLCQRCFPLDSHNVIEMIGEDRLIRPTSFDGMVNIALKSGIRAFCCLPPLALSPNDHADSDTRIRPKS